MRVRVRVRVRVEVRVTERVGVKGPAEREKQGKYTHLQKGPLKRDGCQGESQI